MNQTSHPQRVHLMWWHCWIDPRNSHYCRRTTWCWRGMFARYQEECGISGTKMIMFVRRNVMVRLIIRLGR